MKMKNVKNIVLAVALPLLLLVAVVGLVRAQETERVIHVDGPFNALQLTAEGITFEELTGEMELWVGGNAYYTSVSWTENLTAEIDSDSWPDGWESAKPLVVDDFDRLNISASAGVTETSNPTYFQPLPEPPPPTVERVIQVKGPADALVLTAQGISFDELTGKVEVWIGGNATYPNVNWTEELTATVDTTEWSEGWESAKPLVEGDFDRLDIAATAGVTNTDNLTYFGPIQEDEPEEPTVFKTYLPSIQFNAGSREVRVSGPLYALRLEASASIPVEDLTGKIIVWANGTQHELDLLWDGGVVVVDTTKWPVNDETGLWESASPLVVGGYEQLVIDQTSAVYRTNNPQYMAPK